MAVKAISVWQMHRMRRWQYMQLFLLSMLLYKCKNDNPIFYFASWSVLQNIQLAKWCQLFETNNSEFYQFVTYDESFVTTARSADTPHSANILALDLKSNWGEKCVCGELSLLTISLAGNVHPHTNTLKYTCTHFLQWCWCQQPELA